MEFGSSILNDIWGFYTAPDTATFEAKTEMLADKFEQLERRLGDGPYFADMGFTLADAVFGPVFRYFDVFDKIGDFGVLADKPKVGAWRHMLSTRPSIQNAVAKDYEQRLWAFLEARKSHLSKMMEREGGSRPFPKEAVA